MEISFMAAGSFALLGTSFLSLWIRRDFKIWGVLASTSLLLGLMSGTVFWNGALLIFGLSLLWILYYQKPQFLLFVSLICFCTSFKLRFFPGFQAIMVSPKFYIGWEVPFLGLFPLALFAPLSKTFKEWKAAFKGLAIGCIGIGVMAVLATVTGATQWHIKLPTFMALRSLTNLVFTCIPEEGLYRGFIQNRLCEYFKNIRFGKAFALILTSLIFTVAHLSWSPSLAILAFVFIASLLYGAVYLISGKIESAILCHFLLNLMHMTFFSYHAL